MTKLQIRMRQVDQVKDFVDLLSKYPYEMDLVSGRYTIDAKSLLGIYSLDLSNPLTLVIYSDSCEELLTQLFFSFFSPLLYCNKICKTILTLAAIRDTLYRKSHQFCRKVQSGEDLFPMKIFTAPQHTRSILPPFHPTKFFACLAGRYFLLGSCTLNSS